MIFCLGDCFPLAPLAQRLSRECGVADEDGTQQTKKLVLLKQVFPSYLHHQHGEDNDAQGH
jgi:hypothetical protein